MQAYGCKPQYLINMWMMTDGDDVLVEYENNVMQNAHVIVPA